MIHDTRINVLLALANPDAQDSGLDPLRLLTEQRVILQAIERSRFRDRVSVKVVPAATVTDLQRALLDGQYQIVHVSSHGSRAGFLIFENELGEKHHVRADALAELFRANSPPIDCIVLNGCESMTAGELTSFGVPFTIGMDGSIDDDAGIKFSEGFYDAIGAGKSYEEAFEGGWRAVKLADPDFEFNPAFLKNDAKIAELARAAEPSRGLTEDYRQRVHAQYEHIHLDLTEETLRLDDSYVRLAVAAPAPKAKDEPQEAPPRLETLEPEAASAKYPALWIEGDPGAGKTTMLHYLMRRLSAPDSGSLIPVYVASETVSTSEGALVDAIRARVGCAPSDAPAWTFVVMVDAMDQAPNAAPILHNLGALMLQRNVRLVTTSRPALQPPTPSTWVKVQLQPLSEDLIRKFLQERSAAELAERLPGEVRPGGVLSVPLLLHIAAKIASRLGRDERLTRTAVLGPLLDYVEDRDRARGFAPPAGAREKLEALAWQMRIASGRTSFDAGLATQAGLTRDDLAQIVRSGLVRKEAFEYSFAHLLIAEYLAAAYLVRQPPERFPALLWQSWRPLFVTDVLPLACALWPDLDSFLRSVVLQMPETARDARLRLIGRCLRERRVTPDETAFAKRVRRVVQAIAVRKLLSRKRLYAPEANDLEWATLAGESVLIDLLDERSSRASAAIALGHMRSAQAFDRLKSLAGERDTCWAVFSALEAIRPGSAFEHIVALSADPDPDAREEAARALGTWWTDRSLDPLLRLWDDPDAIVRTAAVAVAGWQEVPREMLARVTPHLIALLGHDEMAVRYGAADVLSKVDRTEDKAPLFEMLTDDSAAVRAAAVRAIGKRTLSVNLPRVAALLEDPDPEVRVQVIYAVANHHELITDALEKLLDDPDRGVRFAVTFMLPKIKTDRAEALLLERLTSDKFLVANVETERAIDILVDLLEKPERADFLPQIANGLTSISAANQPSERTIDAVLPLLESPDPEIRKLAVDVLRDAKSKKIIEPLMRMLRDPDCQIVASMALEPLVSESQVDALIELLQNSDTHYVASKLLEEIGSPRGIEAILDAHHSDHLGLLQSGAALQRDPRILLRVAALDPDTLYWCERGSDLFPLPLAATADTPWKWTLFPSRVDLDDVAGQRMSLSYDDQGVVTIRLGDTTITQAITQAAAKHTLQLGPVALRSFSDICLAAIPHRWRVEPHHWLTELAPELKGPLAGLDDAAVVRAYTYSMLGLYLMGLSRPAEASLASQYGHALAQRIKRSPFESQRLVVNAWLTTCVIEASGSGGMQSPADSIVSQATDREGAAAAFNHFGAPAFDALRQGTISTVLKCAPFATWIRIARTMAVPTGAEGENDGIRLNYDDAFVLVDGVVPAAVDRVDDLWNGLRTGIVPGALSISPLFDAAEEYSDAVRVTWKTVRNDYFDALKLYRPILDASGADVSDDPADTEGAPDRGGIATAIRRLFGLGRRSELR